MLATAVLTQMPGVAQDARRLLTGNQVPEIGFRAVVLHCRLRTQRPTMGWYGVTLYLPRPFHTTALHHQRVYVAVDPATRDRVEEVSMIDARADQLVDEQTATRLPPNGHLDFKMGLAVPDDMYEFPDAAHFVGVVMFIFRHNSEGRVVIEQAGVGRACWTELRAASSKVPKPGEAAAVVTVKLNNTFDEEQAQIDLSIDLVHHMAALMSATSAGDTVDSLVQQGSSMGGADARVATSQVSSMWQTLKVFSSSKDPARDAKLRALGATRATRLRSQQQHLARMDFTALPMPVTEMNNRGVLERYFGRRTFNSMFGRPLPVWVHATRHEVDLTSIYTIAHMLESALALAGCPSAQEFATHPFEWPEVLGQLIGLYAHSCPYKYDKTQRDGADTPTEQFSQIRNHMLCEAQASGDCEDCASECMLVYTTLLELSSDNERVYLSDELHALCHLAHAYAGFIADTSLRNGNPVASLLDPELDTGAGVTLHMCFVLIPWAKLERLYTGTKLSPFLRASSNPVYSRYVQNLPPHPEALPMLLVEATDGTMTDTTQTYGFEAAEAFDLVASRDHPDLLDHLTKMNPWSLYAQQGSHRWFLQLYNPSMTLSTGLTSLVPHENGKAAARPALLFVGDAAVELRDGPSLTDQGMHDDLVALPRMVWDEEPCIPALVSEEDMLRDIHEQSGELMDTKSRFGHEHKVAPLPVREYDEFAVMTREIDLSDELTKQLTDVAGKANLRLRGPFPVVLFSDHVIEVWYAGRAAPEE